MLPWLLLLSLGLPQGRGRAQDAPQAAQTLPAPGIVLADPPALEPSRALRAEAERWRAQRAASQQAQQQAPELLAEVEATLEELREAQVAPIDLGVGAEELALQLAVAEQELAELEGRAAELEAEPARRSQRRQAMPALIARATAALRALDAAPVQGAQEGSPELRELEREALRAEIAAHEAELLSYDTGGALLARRRDLARLRVTAQRRRTAKLREALTASQREQVRDDARRSRELLRKVDDLPPQVQPPVRQLAERNLALTELWEGEEGLVEKLGTVSERLSRARTAVSAVEAELSRLSAKVEAAGLAESVGAMLRRERANAPDVGMYRRFVQLRAEQIGEAQLQQLRLAEQREQLADVDARVQEALAAMGDALDDASRPATESLLYELFEHQRKYMDALVSDYDEYFHKLVEFDAEQRALIDRSEKLIEFINERVLWVRSGGVMGSELPGDTAEAFDWLFGARYWAQLGKAVRDGFVTETFTHLLLVLLGVAWVTAYRPLSRCIYSYAAEVRSSGGQRFAATGKTLGVCLLLGWMPSLWLALWGRTLGDSAAATQFTRCVAHGLICTAALWASLSLPRWVLAEDSLAMVHCRWPRDASLELRRRLGWLSIVLLPASFLVFVFEARGDDAMRESLARVVFLLAMLALGIVCHLLLREKGALTALLRARRASPLPLWARRALDAAATGLPFALAAAAIAGFYWTALQLAVRLHFTMCLLFVLWVASDLLRRWASLAERSVAAARAKQAAEAAQVPASEAGELTETAQALEVPAEGLDLETVSVQTQRLTASVLTVLGTLGLGGIWADLLPAAGILRRVELWHVRAQVESTAREAAGEAAQVADVQWVPVTLADLGLALVIGVVCWVLLRNLPGLLEVTLFRRFDAGERYAFATILKYVIATTGILLALDSLGISWASMQWLVAAVGLGLGFGLQEIFANFVSGLLILVERPIRVGDIVTVGDVSGTVTRIHIRATWITSFDRKELVVPNKEFITSKLVNWSLSDRTLRLQIPVGIAYGSDVQRAQEALRAVAQAHPLVLENPAPQALFLEFGDSALGLELRVFVGDPDHALSVTHDLHMAIDGAFREAGIEIAFPQLDVHLASANTPAASMTV